MNLEGRDFLRRANEVAAVFRTTAHVITTYGKRVAAARVVAIANGQEIVSLLSILFENKK